MSLRRLLVVTAAMAVVATACGDGSQPTAIDLGGAPAATEAPGDTQASTETVPATAATAETDPAEPVATEAPRQRPEGPDAADFELALGGPGGTFSLSAETRPVFMVFWAEW
jgi:hypothetical protein